MTRCRTFKRANAEDRTVRADYPISSLNRLPFIVRLLSVTDSTLFWRNFRGSGHHYHVDVERSSVGESGTPYVALCVSLERLD